MHASLALIGAFAAFLETASAHGYVTGVKSGSAWTPGADPVWFYAPSDQRKATAGWNSLNQDLGFVEPNALGTSDAACHKSATAGRLYADVAAGSTIQLPWNTWPSDSHKGPVVRAPPCDFEMFGGES